MYNSILMSFFNRLQITKDFRLKFKILFSRWQGYFYFSFCGFMLFLVKILTPVVLTKGNILSNTLTRGDFVLFGNTLGQNCAPGVPAPVVGTVSSCGTNTEDDGIDVYWLDDGTTTTASTTNGNTFTSRYLKISSTTIYRYAIDAF